MLAPVNLLKRRSNWKGLLRALRLGFFNSVQHEFKRVFRLIVVNFALHTQIKVFDSPHLSFCELLDLKLHLSPSVVVTLGLYPLLEVRIRLSSQIVLNLLLTATTTMAPSAVHPSPPNPTLDTPNPTPPT